MGLKTSARDFLYLLAVCSPVSLLSSCAHTPQASGPSRANTSVQAMNEPDQTQAQIAKLQEKIQDLEIRLSALNDKINLENGFSSASNSAPGAPNSETPLPTAVVEAPAAHGKVIPKITLLKKSKTPEAAAENFSHSEAIDRFREAKILFDSQRYSDAVLEFSEFVKNEPEHPLAPAAQYFVGMSYIRQKEYKLGEEELSRGLLAYSHSSYIPDTLAGLAEVSELLGRNSKVTYYREKLFSHFPNSPQAKHFNSKKANVSKAPVQTAPLAMEGEASVVNSRDIEHPIAPTIATPKLEEDKE